MVQVKAWFNHGGDFINIDTNFKIVITANKPSPDALENFHKKLCEMQNNSSITEVINETKVIDNYENTNAENDGNLF